MALGLLSLIILILFRAPSWRRDHRRKEILSRPFPTEWRRIVETFPLYQTLSGKDQEELLQKMQILLCENVFVGCNDAVIDDDLKLMIASGACLLLLHRQTEFYSALSEILIYPNPFTHCRRQVLEGGFINEESSVLLGEASNWGKSSSPRIR